MEEETTETKQEEKLFAGKYKTPEELEKGYLEAQKKMTESTTEASQAKKRLQELEAQLQEASEPQKEEDEPDTDMTAYEYLTKAEMIKALKKEKEEMQNIIKQNQEELKQYLTAVTEIGKIRNSHPGLSDKTIQSVINEFPDESDFDAALGKYRENLAKELGLNTSEPETKVNEVNIPSHLKGMQGDVRESEDRSRIDRIKKAGTSGSMKSVLQKK